MCIENMRFKFDLNGLWFFQIDPDDIGTQQQWFHIENYQYIENKYEIPVPGSWNVIDITNNELCNYKGIGWYFKQFILPSEFSEKKSTLYFQAVNFKAEIFLDGKKIGEHEGGFTPFSIDLTGISTEETHFLVLKVINEEGYGGIHRDVFIEFYDWVYLEEYKISQEIVWKQDNTPKMAKVTVKTYFKNNTDYEWKGTIDHIFTRENALISINKQRQFNIQNKNSRLLTTVVEIDEPLLWSPENPFIYDLILDVKNDNGDIIEQIRTIVGIREFSTEENQLILNKKPYELKGVRKQFENGDFGYSIPKNMVLNELKAMKQQKINTLHFATHPEDEFIFRILDRLGFLVIEEIGLDDMTKPISNKLLEDMISRDINKTCILSWNWLSDKDRTRSINLSILKHIYEKFEQI